MKTFKATYSYLPYLRPALVSGTHTIRIQQRLAKVRGEEELERFERSQQIIVRTPRLSIEPEQVHACYPPEGHTGNYEHQIPYVVLSQATLPWQLSASSHRDHGNPPWLALLLFDDLEPAAQVAVTTLLELTQGSCFAPATRRLATGEVNEDVVTVLTLPRDQFEALAPTLEDLPWLTHVRRVTVDAKAGSTDAAASEDYAVVMANRSCLIGRRYTAHLVAMDDMAPYLPGSVATDVHYDAVRLVSLLSWSFSCNSDHQGDFTGLLTRIDHGPMALPVKAPGAHDSEAAILVKRAYARGYCALNHQLRNGSRTVSWYRGPLSPLKSAAQSITVAAHSPDSLVRYDPHAGMFDVSHAVAWQLGRQLALSDKAFGSALYRYRAVKLHAEDGTEQVEQIQRLTGITEPALERISSSAVDIARAASGVSLDTAALHQWLRAPSNTDSRYDANADLSLIGSYLQRLAMLQGVNVRYLVPEPAMLPEESLRFFELDRDWLTALLDGAMSLGCDDPRGEVERRRNIIEQCLRNVTRERAEPISDDLRCRQTIESSTVISGFVLHSRVVQAWPGLEAQAFAKDEKPLAQLYMEHLTPSILLCLFSGPISSARLVEPAQSQSMQMPPSAQMRGKVWAPAHDAISCGWQDAGWLAGSLANASGAVTFEMRDQKQ